VEDIKLGFNGLAREIVAMLAFQLSTTTSFMRYETFFDSLCRSNVLSSAPRILIFGCSTGEEIRTVNHFWRDATVFACDIREDVLNVAASNNPNATIFVAAEDKLRSIGLFDLICANSVFCRNPLPKEGISKVIPFDRFDQYCTLLSGLTRRGGYLMMYNTNYFFQDSTAAAEFTPIIIPGNWTGAFVPRIDRTGRVVARPVPANSSIREYIFARPGVVTSIDRMASAVFEKTPAVGAGPVTLQPTRKCSSSVAASGLPTEFPRIKAPALTYLPHRVETIVKVGDARYLVTRTYVNDFLFGGWIFQGETRSPAT
jgi:hypothetical protein